GQIMLCAAACTDATGEFLRFHGCSRPDPQRSWLDSRCQPFGREFRLLPCPHDGNVPRAGHHSELHSNDTRGNCAPRREPSTVFEDGQRETRVLVKDANKAVCTGQSDLRVCVEARCDLDRDRAAADGVTAFDVAIPANEGEVYWPRVHK